MSDVLKNLKQLMWKDIILPMEMLEFGFSSDIQQQKFIFKSDAISQTLGRKNPSWKITIPFSENVFAFGKYFNLYTEVFPKFLEACRDPSPGELHLPDLGVVRAACASLSYTIDPSKMRDGVRVVAEFVYSPSEEDLLTQTPFNYPTIDNVKSLSQDLDSTVALANLPVEDQPKPTVDPFQFIQSVTDQISAARDKTKGKLDQVSDKVDKVNQSIARVSDPKNWQITRQANDLKLTLFDTKKQLDNGGNTIKSYVVTQGGITLNALAALFKMNMKDFIKLNGRFAKNVIVPPNSTVYYK